MLKRYIVFTALIGCSMVSKLSAITPVRLVAGSLGVGTATYLALEAIDTPKSLNCALSGLTGAAMVAAALRRDARNFQKYKSLIASVKSTINHVERDPLLSGIKIDNDLIESGYDKFLLHYHITDICKSSKGPFYAFREAQHRLKSHELNLKNGVLMLEEARELSDKGGFIEVGKNSGSSLPFITHHSSSDLSYANKHYTLAANLGTAGKYFSEGLLKKVMHQKEYVDKYLEEYVDSRKYLARLKAKELDA